MKIANQTKNEPFVPSAFQEFLRTWVSRLSLTMIASRIEPFLDLNDLPGLKINALLHAFDSHPLYKESYLKWVISKRGEDATVSSFDGCIRMMGLRTTTHFLIVCLLGERLNAKSLQRDPKTDFLPGTLEQILRYAYLAQNTFQKGTRYDDLFFNLGLFFDYVRFYNELHSPVDQKKKLDSFIQNRFDIAVKASGIALEIIKARPTLCREKDVLPLLFLECASQAIFALFHCTYPDFLFITDKIKMRPSLVHYAEELRFGGHHSNFGSSSVFAIPQFANLGQACVELSNPSRLVGTEHTDIFELTSVVFLSLYLLKNQKELPKSVPFELRHFSHPVDFDSIIRKAS